uniref:Cytochrome b561 and DOMON domain-containing protein n=1 Tax=Noccaea caerulescens TaxID=107243 RepID=A0A1J3DRJ8_NOCCA
MKLYSISFIFGLIALQFIPLSTIVHAQQAGDSCNSTLPLINLTFDSTILQCVEAWSLQNYILRYAKTVDNTWSFILSVPDSSAYIGIGFSTNGRMIGSSAIVGWISTDSRSGEAKQYSLEGRSPDEVTPDQGDLKIINGSLKIESVSSRLYMSFQLTAELPRHNLLYALGPAGFFPSSPDFRLREHRVVTTTTINYNIGPAMSPGPAQAPETKPSQPSLTPSSAYGLSPSLLFFGIISLVTLKFY